MTLLTWTTDNSVGVAEIDLQHQKIFSLINELSTLISESKAREEIDRIVGELIDYTDYHFKTEEKYFRKFSYEYEGEHTKTHEWFKLRVQQFIKDKENGLSAILPYTILNFLEDWWLNHINGVDKRYTECFHNHGLY
jgi:hemerythrin